MRPRQWVKNLLVLIAPLAAGELFKWPVLSATGLAFIAFCLVSSSTYLVNDSMDVDRDRAHPTKRNRPVASGALPVGFALASAAALAALGLTVGFLTASALGWVLMSYLVVTILYSLRFKHAPVVELVLLAMGFLLRAVGGGAASDLPISSWFLLVAGFGSLFVAAGKRYSELVRVSDTDMAQPVRGSLAGYSVSYLRFAWTVCAAVTITTYCLWAVEVGGQSSIPWSMMSIVPFSLGILRYAIDIDRGGSEVPEDTFLANLSLVVYGMAWALLFGLGAMGVG